MLKLAPARAADRGRADLLAQDRSGAVAVEFAFVAPVLLLLLFGLAEFAPAIAARSKLDHMTESTADLTAEFTAMQTSDMTSMFSAAGDLLAPFSASGLTLRLTSVYADGSGNAYVYWSCGQGSLAPYPANSKVTTLPNGAPVSNLLLLTPVNYNGQNLGAGISSFVMAESKVTYTPSISYANLLPPTTYSGVAFVLPRQSPYVSFPWDGSSNTPPQPASNAPVGMVNLSNGASCNYVN